MALFSTSTTNKNEESMAKTSQYEGGNTSINTLSNETKVIGDIESKGDIRFDGCLEGNIICKGKVVLGQSALVRGTVNCKVADISGEVFGTVTATELINLKSTARINGDVHMAKLSVDPGAVFTGNCKMLNENGKVISNPSEVAKPEKNGKK